MKKIEAAVNEFTYRGFRELQRRIHRVTGDRMIAYGQIMDAMVWQALAMDDQQLLALWENEKEQQPE